MRKFVQQRPQQCTEVPKQVERPSDSCTVLNDTIQHCNQSRSGIFQVVSKKLCDVCPACSCYDMGAGFQGKNERKFLSTRHGEIFSITFSKLSPKLRPNHNKHQ